MFPTVFVGTGVRGANVRVVSRAEKDATTVRRPLRRRKLGYNPTIVIPQASGKIHNTTRNRDAVYDEAHSVGSHGSVPVTQRGCGMKI